MSILDKVKKNISKFNFNSGTINRIKYIVIHYVGATGSAKANCEYYAGGDRGASAHYFVDFNGDVYQSVEDKNIAWHCGSKVGYKHPICRNANSIGIELCCRTTGDPTKADDKWYFEDATVASAVELTMALMRKYNIPAENVIRHYDVTGKTCPAPYVFNNKKHTWTEFQKVIKGGSTSTSKNQNQTNSQKNIDEIAWDMFRKEGFSEIETAAWFGNIKGESEFKPNNVQDSYENAIGYNDETYTAAVDSKAYSKDKFVNDKVGYGLAQWTYWSRKKMMYEYIVEKAKKSIGDPITQIEFMLYEIRMNYTGLVKRLKNCKTVEAASDLILEVYENPKVKNYQTRRNYSLEFYKKFAGKTISNGSTTSNPKPEASTTTSETTSNSLMTANACPFLVQITATDLNIRKSPNGEKWGKYTGAGTFTIVDVQGDWGLLKAYQSQRNGWIHLGYATRVK